MDQSPVVATPDMCALCFDRIQLEWCSKSSLSPHPRNPSRLVPTPDVNVSLFVTWDKYNAKEGEFQLRGCIGTFGKPRLAQGLQQYAVISAFEDDRFTPIQKEELPKLRCGINLLHQFEYGNNVYDWEIGKHGVHIYFSHPKTGRKCSATYLPLVIVDMNWNKDETLASLYRKAGYHGPVTQSLLENTRLERYQSSICKLTYSEYSEKYQNKTELESQGLLGSTTKLS